MRRIGIINVGCGNIGSLFKALDRDELDVRIAARPADLDGVSTIFLPGSGSAGMFKRRLVETGFDDAVASAIANGTPLVGICLGFQLLFDRTEEDGGVDGFGYFRGDVVQLATDDDGASSVRTGWFETSGGLALGLDTERPFAYYNHGFGTYPSVDLGGFETGTSGSVLAWIKSGSVAGFQFHPEKSQTMGARLISKLVDGHWLV